jgi:hypothetical protein
VLHQVAEGASWVQVGSATGKGLSTTLCALIGGHVWVTQGLPSLLSGEITVFDPTNTVLGSASIVGVNFQSPAFVGVVTGAGAAIGRINLWGGGVAGTGQGADDIAVYTFVP